MSGEGNERKRKRGEVTIMAQWWGGCSTLPGRACGSGSGGFPECAEGAFDDGGGVPGGGFVFPTGAERADPLRIGFAGVVEPVGDGVANVFGGIGSEWFEDGEAGGGIGFELGDVAAPDPARAGGFGGEASEVGVGLGGPWDKEGDGVGKVGGDVVADGEPCHFADAHVMVGGERADSGEPCWEVEGGVLADEGGGPCAGDVGCLSDEGAGESVAGA